MKIKPIFILLVVFAVSSSSCRGTPRAYVFEVFESGENIRQIQLKGESAIQLSYEVALTYPDNSVLEFYKERLSADGWQSCMPENKWDQQLKKDGPHIEGVRQLISYAVQKDANQLLMISLRYHSDRMAEVSEKIRWHNQAQYVTLVVYTVEDLDKVLNSLSLNCSE